MYLWEHSFARWPCKNSSTDQTISKSTFLSVSHTFSSHIASRSDTSHSTVTFDFILHSHNSFHHSFSDHSIHRPTSVTLPPSHLLTHLPNKQWPACHTWRSSTVFGVSSPQSSPFSATPTLDTMLFETTATFPRLPLAGQRPHCLLFLPMSHRLLSVLNLKVSLLLLMFLFVLFFVTPTNTHCLPFSPFQSITLTISPSVRWTPPQHPSRW